MLRFIILALIVGLGSSVSTDDCPGGLARNNFLKALGDKCYRFVTRLELDYWKARLNCGATGGTLAIANSKKISNFLYYHLKYTYQATDEYWIGLNDKKTENTFVWEDGTSLGFSNFAKKEGPRKSFLQGGLEDCVAIDTESQGKWRDYRCSTRISLLNPKKNFICEYDMKKKPTTTATTVPAATAIATATPTTGGIDHARCPTLDNCNLQCEDGLKVNALGCAECECADD